MFLSVELLSPKLVHNVPFLFTLAKNSLLRSHLLEWVTSNTGMYEIIILLCMSVSRIWEYVVIYHPEVQFALVIFNTAICALCFKIMHVLMCQIYFLLQRIGGYVTTAQIRTEVCLARRVCWLSLNSLSICAVFVWSLICPKHSGIYTFGTIYFIVILSNHHQTFPAHACRLICVIFFPTLPMCFQWAVGCPVGPLLIQSRFGADTASRHELARHSAPLPGSLRR